MPLYEYHCTHCNEHTELLQKISDEPAKTCPHCNHDSLVKRISSTNFQLKGAGWYVTDFKDKKDKKENKSTSEPENKPAAEKSETSKTVSEKPSEKTEKKES